MRHKDHAGESSGEIKKAGVYFGIDLGTSNCSVSYVVASQRRNIGIQPKVVEFPFGGDKGQKSARFPSVIAKKEPRRAERSRSMGLMPRTGTGFHWEWTCSVRSSRTWARSGRTSTHS